MIYAQDSNQPQTKGRTMYNQTTVTKTAEGWMVICNGEMYGVYNTEERALQEAKELRSYLAS